MVLAEIVVNAYNSRAKSKNWVEWADQNPYESALLIMAVKDGD